MKRIIKILFAFIIIQIIYSVYLGVIKPVVVEMQIKDKNYILCEEVLVTGADWYMIKDEQGNDECCYVDIKGIDEFEKDMPRYLGGNNTYVFYIKDKYMGINELHEEMLIYEAYDWDMLFPVVRGERFLGLLEPCWLLTQNDINSHNYKWLYYWGVMLIIYWGLKAIEKKKRL